MVTSSGRQIQEMGIAKIGDWKTILNKLFLLLPLVDNKISSIFVGFRNKR